LGFLINNKTYTKINQDKDGKNSKPWDSFQEISWIGLAWSLLKLKVMLLAQLGLTISSLLRRERFSCIEKFLTGTGCFSKEKENF